MIIFVPHIDRYRYLDLEKNTTLYSTKGLEVLYQGPELTLVSDRTAEEWLINPLVGIVSTIFEEEI